MSKLLKKFTAAISAVMVLFSIVTPVAGVNAAYSSSLDAANKLASVGVIVDQSANPADYRLGDNLSRRELIKIAILLSSSELNTAYAGKFSDVSQSDWAWKYAETAVDNGFIAANATFSPSRNVSKAEALKVIMNATGVEKANTGADNFWSDYVTGAVTAGIVESFSDYDTAAQRGWIFKVAANALESEDADDDILDDLLDGLDDDDGTGSTDTGSTVSGDDVLTIALSADTPEGANVPGSVNGLPVVAYDFTAGSEDVTVTSVIVKRKGLSDDATLDGLAAFSDEGRASKAKDDSQNNNTEATLTLTNGFVVKAGETRTLTIVADLGVAPGVANDEFAIELVEVVASTDAEKDGSLVGNSFRIGSVNAPTLAVEKDTSVADVTLGAEGANIFKFKVKNSNDEEMILKSITFKSVDSDVEEDLSNFKLLKGSTEIAATAAMTDKYLTFTFGDGYSIAKNQTEKFTVIADVVAGADDNISFYIDRELDVTAEGTKYGYGAAIDISSINSSSLVIDTVKIDAGELTLVDIDPSSDKIREDKDDVTLAKIKITNVAGQNLELQEFGVLLEPTGITDLEAVFENFELVNEDSGASYDLTLYDITGNDYANPADTDGVVSDDDLNITLPQGTTNYVLRADTKTSIATFDNFEMDLSLTTGNLAVATGGFYVVETDDDTEVTDITPSKLSWKKIKGSESGATVANVPLSDTNAVRGSDDVVALQFDVEADETSAISMDEATVKLTRNDGTVAADQQDLASVALYKGSVSEANLLDRASGSKIATDGSVTFDGFDIDIAADATQTFVVTLSFVDGLDPVGFDFEAQLTGLSLEDDDSDDVTVATLPVPSNAVIAGNTGNREITVTSAGSITTLETKSSRSDNEYVKSVLAGTSKKVVSYDVRADNEEVDVETVVFTYDDGANNLDLGSAGATASLYLGDTLIATNSNSDITSTTITFDNLTTLIIPETTSELKLAINTEDVGQDKVGSTGAGLQITNVSLQDMEGASSGIAIANMNSTSDTYSQLFSVVPATVVASVNSSFGTDDGSAEVTLTYDAGDNTSSNGDDLQVEFVALDIEVSSFKTAGTLTLFNGNGDQVGTVAVGANGTVTINLPATAGFDETVTDNSEKYRIESTAEASFRVAKDGVDYNVDAAGADYTMLLQNSQSIGTYAESN